MKIPLSKPYFDDEEVKAVSEVIESGWVMQGKKVEEFERMLANYIGVKYAVLVSSGTAALHLSMLALGISKGDEVIVPSFSFVASANCILYAGAKPVFADIDIKTYNIDPNDIGNKITKKTKAIIVVHQVGLSADMAPILEIAKKNNLTVIEDAACSLGAKYKGKNVGTFGKIACFSFHPRKSITTGEGGLIVTQDENIASLVKSLRSHGVEYNDGEKFVRLGYNYRMTDLQAAMGIAQFRKLNQILKKKEKISKRYNDAFSESGQVVPPYVPSDCIHTYQSYLVRIKKGRSVRDRLIKELGKKGIASKPSVTAIHEEPLYKKDYGKESLPMTEKANSEGLILPFYPQMTESDQDYVINSLMDAL